MSKQVRIKLGPDGSIRAEAFGFKGASCEEATAFLNKLFGDPESKELKDSYYEQEVIIENGLPSGHCG